MFAFLNSNQNIGPSVAEKLIERSGGVKAIVRPVLSDQLFRWGLSKCFDCTLILCRERRDLTCFMSDDNDGAKRSA